MKTIDFNQTTNSANGVNAHPETRQKPQISDPKPPILHEQKRPSKKSEKSKIAFDYLLLPPEWRLVIESDVSADGINTQNSANHTKAEIAEKIRKVQCVIDAMQARIKEVNNEIMLNRLHKQEKALNKNYALLNQVDNFWARACDLKEYFERELANASD